MTETTSHVEADKIMELTNLEPALDLYINIFALWLAHIHLNLFADQTGALVIS